MSLGEKLRTKRPPPPQYPIPRIARGPVSGYVVNNCSAEVSTQPRKIGFSIHYPDNGAVAVIADIEGGKPVNARGCASFDITGPHARDMALAWAQALLNAVAEWDSAAWVQIRPQEHPDPTRAVYHDAPSPKS